MLGGVFFGPKEAVQLARREALEVRAVAEFARQWFQSSMVVKIDCAAALAVRTFEDRRPPHCQPKEKNWV